MDDKQIQACEELWQMVLLIEEFVGKIIFLDDILLAGEYNMPQTYNILGFKPDEQIIIKRTNSVEKIKIYISDDLFRLFFIYRAIFLRIHLKYYEGKEKKNIVHFMKDDFFLNKMHDLKLTEESIIKISNMKMGALRYLNNLLKDMILVEIRNILKSQNKTPNFHIENINNQGILSLQNQGIQKNKLSSNNSKSWQDNIGIYLAISFFLLIAGLLIEHYFFK